MPRRRKATQEDVNNDHKGVTAMADRMGLKGEERSRYIHSHMTKLGHKPNMSYVPNDEDDDKSDGNDDDPFFS